MKSLYRALVVLPFGFVPFLWTPMIQAENTVPHQEIRQDMPGSGKHYPYDEAKSEELYKKESLHADKIQEQIDLMNSQMKAIHQEKDPAKCSALVKEHNKTMQKAMAMIGKSGSTDLADDSSSSNETKH